MLNIEMVSITEMKRSERANLKIQLGSQDMEIRRNLAVIWSEKLSRDNTGSIPVSPLRDDANDCERGQRLGYL